MPSRSWIGRVLGPLGFALLYWGIEPTGLSTEGQAILAATFWIAVWWITEAIPVEVTGLLPMILFPLTGAVTIREATTAFGHPFIFLFVGGFILAIAIEKWTLHRRIAYFIIRQVGQSPPRVLLGFMVSSAFLSMWISNTATTVMMLPIGLAVIHQFKDKPYEQALSKALMLGIAYSASIGGIATLIGTPPNLIMAGVLEESFDISLGFSEWMIVGLPIAIVLLGICWWYLSRVAFALHKIPMVSESEDESSMWSSLGPMSVEEKRVALIFALTAMAWILRAFVLQKLWPPIDDTVIALTAATVLFLVPAREKGQTLLSWRDAVKLPWGVLLLFGGGIAIAYGFTDSGLSAWIGTQMGGLKGLTLVFILLIVIASVNFLTEITSNLATTAVMLPLLIPLASILNVHPFVFLVGATTAASCAFMLPVATPPNALVFGSGKVTVTDMVRTGIWMNILSILLLFILVYFLMPILWGIDLHSYPVEVLINLFG